MSKLIGTTVTLEDLLKSDGSKYLYEDPEGEGPAGGWGSSAGPGLLVPLPEREKKTSGCVRCVCAYFFLFATAAYPPPPLSHACTQLQ